MQVAVAILVLQTLAVKRGAPGVAPIRNPRAWQSPAAQARSPMR